MASASSLAVTMASSSQQARTGTHRVLASDDKQRWIDQVALGPDNAVAWSAGKTAHVLTKKGEERLFEAPSTVAGLAFAPKGFPSGHRAL